MASLEQQLIWKLEREIKQLRTALEEIVAIADGSRTVNSLPHLAKIAGEALKATKA